MKKLFHAVLIGALAFAWPALASDQSPIGSYVLTSTTTAFAGTQWMAPAVTAAQPAGFIPSFQLNGSVPGSIPVGRLRLKSSDATSTAWGAATVSVDILSAAPTFSITDRQTYQIGTGGANWLATFTCGPMVQDGDGAHGGCAVSVGNFATIRLPIGSPIYWTAYGASAGTVGASKTLTIEAETVN